MATETMTQEHYQAAAAALNTIIWSPASSRQQKDLARAARTDLTLDFIGQQIDEVVARTAQFKAFISRMEGVLAAMGGAGPVGAVVKLTTVIGDAKAVLDVVAGIAGGPRTVAAAPLSRGVSGRAKARGLGGAPQRILCVHGVGHHTAASDWVTAWPRVIREGLQRWNPTAAPEFAFCFHDDLFEAHPLDPAVIAEAVWRLGVSGVVHGVGDLFRRRRGLSDVSDSLRWTAGMVAQWAESESLRRELRDRLTQHINDNNPDIICAHSLGSLVAYDTLRDNPAMAAGRTLVTFGSQLGNPFVRNALGGRLQPLDRRARWYNLFNKNDDAFTKPVRIASDNFWEIGAEFDIPGMMDHDAGEYLSHPNTVGRVWSAVAGAPATRGARGVKVMASRNAAVFREVARKPDHRALLVGINDYPNAADKLEGCVNDVFLMSAVLQESGFRPEDIRVVLDDRATAAGVKDRLQWLLDGVCPGDTRFFYYSGHGAQIPAYGVRDEVDHVDECLVTHDFDWTRERCVTDDHFFDLYSQLPYDSTFVSIFDCCHSGGMARSGGPRVRGLSPPDDVRHRQLRWRPELQMWEERELAEANRQLAGNKDEMAAYVGKDGATHRLGRAIPLRQLPEKAYNRVRAAGKHMGPYLPIILEACAEQEESFEYRHGATPYGAFTFALAAAMRQARAQGKPVTFERLRADAAVALKALGFRQSPCLIGPKKVIRAAISWTAGPLVKAAKVRVAKTSARKKLVRVS